MIDATLKLIQEHKLDPVVRWILEHNTSQALPYHSFNHALWVMFYSHKCYESLPTRNDFSIDLLLAALFHDFHHSGGLFDDSKNIELAIAGFRQFHAANSRCKRSECYLSPIVYNIHEVEYLIKATEFPYDRTSLTGCAQAIRDADMMQNCNETGFNNLVEIRHKCFKHMGWDEYLEKFVAFFDGIRFYTAYGQDVGAKGIAKAKSRIETFRHLIASK